MACDSIALALQDLCTSIQELASDPSSFVLHRSHCSCLAASYSAATHHVLQQLQHTLSTFLNPQAHRELEPSLSELQHVILQGYKFMQDCLHQQGWVKKAVFLALSTEALDVHLHDLVWCLCVIQQAMGQLVLQTHELDTNVYTTFSSIWAEASHKNDLQVLLKALESKITCAPAQKISRKKVKAEQSLAEFLFKRLSWESDHTNASTSSDHLPQCLWVDPNKFSIKDSIGCGAFAVVHEVEWNGQTYGQKEFFEVDAGVFAREAAIQARLRHPNLLQLICCTSKPSKNKCSLVMELMDTNLRNIIDKRQKSGTNPPFSLLMAVDLMLQIAKGMEHLHDLHIMHRDLKSLNVLVTNQVPTGGTSSDCRMHLKIADFGMSKAKNQSSKFTTLHVGTSYWRAPEVFHVNPENEFEGQSSAKYTKEADVYSFSMVCFEILSGKVPFDDGGKLGDLHGRLLNGERPKLPVESCPPYLASYIERCWDGNPKERPTFAQISRMLRHLKGILLTSADPLTPLALSVRSLSRIEDNLTQMIGVNWPSTVSGCSVKRTLTISFEMSWYTVMECKLTKEERMEALKGVAISQSSDSNYYCYRKIRTFFRSVSGIMVLFSWSSLKLSGNKAQMEGDSDSKGRLKCHCLKLRYPVMLLRWIGVRCLRLISCDTLMALKQEDMPSYSLEDPRLSRSKDKLRAVIPQQEFHYSDLVKATNHFQASLGHGGFGKVFKGVLQNGQAVAVKVMSTRVYNSFNDAFEAEIDLLIKVSHPNIVPFLGYCFSEDNHPMLVYKFMPLGDLARHLSNQKGCDMVLTWVQRCKIARGVASALDYLHNHCSPPFLHRDVKPSNILLDEDYNACLSDFGTAMRMADAKNNVPVTGTRGYLDLEYMMTLQLGPETDVYAFGVVLLQLVSGRELVEMDEVGDIVSVMKYVERLYEEDRLVDAVDKRVRVDGRYDPEMSRLLTLGLVCCSSRARDRPSMGTVVKVLVGEIDAPIPAHLG